MFEMRHDSIPATLLDISGRQAQEHPEQIAIICGDKTITAAELSSQGHRTARALRGEGISQGDRICFIAKNEWEFLAITLACIEIQAVLVPINWRLTDREIHHIITHSESKFALIGNEFVDRFRHLPQSATSIARVIHTGAGAESLTEWAKNWSDDPIGEPVNPDAVCYQMYTSGTTGLPKGAMITNRNIAAAMPVTVQAANIAAGSVPLVSSPVFHIAGIAYALAGLWNNGTLVMVKEPSPETLLQAIEDHGVTSSLIVPAMIAMILNHPRSQTADLSSIRRIAYGASPISEDVLRRAISLFDCEFVQFYGLTETTGVIVALPPADHMPDAPPERLQAAGVPFDGVELKIAGPEGEPLSDGDVGEVLTRSAQNMVGYWADEASTRDALTEDGWFRTGDAGYLKEGYLYIHDRIKDMIITGGENVYSTEVENVIMSHPEVADCAVIGVPDPKWGETIKACVVMTADASIGAREIIDHCAKSLAKFKCPTSVDFLEELPRNAAGKMLKRRLRENFWSAQGRQVN